MISHFLVLIAFFNMDELAPKFIAAHTSSESCWIEAQKKNHDDAGLDSDEARALGLHYACLRLVSET